MGLEVHLYVVRKAVWWDPGMAELPYSAVLARGFFSRDVTGVCPVAQSLILGWRHGLTTL